MANSTALRRCAFHAGDLLRSPDAPPPANDTADVHPFAVDALCAPPNKPLQPTVAAAERMSASAQRLIRGIIMREDTLIAVNGTGPES